MPFILNKENYSIKIRKGDSGCLVFKFNTRLDDFYVDFCVARNFNNKILPVISKCYKNIKGNILEVKITSDDTEKFKLDENFTGQYCWSLKLHNNDGFAQTIIPDKFNKTPRFFVYPKLGGCPDEQ